VKYLKNRLTKRPSICLSPSERLAVLTGSAIGFYNGLPEHLKAELAAAVICRLDGKDAVNFYNGLPESLKAEDVTAYVVINRLDWEGTVDFHSRLPKTLQENGFILAGIISAAHRMINRLDGEEAVEFRNSPPENIKAIIQRSRCPEGLASD
jgi:hypothetical protein